MLGVEFEKNKYVIMAMIERNFKGKYGNGRIGIWWNLISPMLLIMAVYFVFVSIKQIGSDADYWIYLSCGIFCISFCSYCLRGRSLVNNSNYVKKMAIPRWIPILADVISQFIILLISLLILTITMFALGHRMDVSAILFLPLELVLIFVAALGLNLIVSVLYVVSYDFGYAVGVLSRIIIWVTPTFFMLEHANDVLQTAAYCNPFTYFVEPLHQIFYYAEMPDLYFVGVGALFSVGFLALGILVFRHYNKKLADII